MSDIFPKCKAEDINDKNQNEFNNLIPSRRSTITTQLWRGIYEI